MDSVQSTCSAERSLARTFVSTVDFRSDGPYRLGRSRMNSARRALAVGFGSCGHLSSPWIPNRAARVDVPIGPPFGPLDLASNRLVSFSARPIISHPTVVVWAHRFESAQPQTVAPDSAVSSLTDSGPDGSCCFSSSSGTACPSACVGELCQVLSPTAIC